MSGPSLTAATPTNRPRERIATVAALLALLALLVGGVAMSWASGAPTAPPWVPFLAAVGLGGVSLFDAFTVPALHDDLADDGPGLVLIATMTALGGDLLNVLGRLFQLCGALALTDGRAEAFAIFDTADTVTNGAGFLLVAVSFTSFGVLWRRRHRLLSVVGVAAGALTALAQVPQLAGLLSGASACYLVWYVALAAHYARLLRRGEHTRR